MVTGGSHWLATRVCTHDSRRSSQRWPLHLEWWSLPSASIGSCFRFWSTRTMRDPRSLNFGSGDVNVLLALQMCRSNRLDMVNWGSLSQLELPVKSFNFRITRSYAGYTSISADLHKTKWLSGVGKEVGLGPKREEENDGDKQIRAVLRFSPSTWCVSLCQPPASRSAQHTRAAARDEVMKLWLQSVVCILVRHQS